MSQATQPSNLFRAGPCTRRRAHATQRRRPALRRLQRVAAAFAVLFSSLAYLTLGPVPASQAATTTAVERHEVRLAAEAEARRRHGIAVRHATLAAADIQADLVERAADELRIFLAAQAEAARLAAEAEAQRLAAEAAEAARRAEAERAAEAARKAAEERAAAARAQAAARARAAAAAAPDRSPGWEQRLGAQALARIRYPVASLGYDIRFLPGRSGLLGMADTDRGWIEIYIRTSHSVEDVAITLAHEIGHAVDHKYNTPDRRRDYLRARGIRADLAWFGCPICTDFATPAGDFAEAFAVAQFGPAQWKGQLGPAPSVAQLADLARFFGP